MTKPSLCSTLLAAALAGAIASPAQAQMRVFVSAQGVDGNPCSFALPCRTFQHAHDVVAANGEIDVLDPAGYGPLTITKSISIQGHGFSGISVPSGANGITINAGAQDIVNLNGLLIDGGNAGANGIAYSSGRSLTITNCVVRRMTSHGLAFDFTLSKPADVILLSVSDSYFNDNSGDGMSIVGHATGTLRAALDRVGFYGNTNGLHAEGSSQSEAIDLSVTDSIAADSAQWGDGLTTGVGFLARASGSVVFLLLSHSKAVNNAAAFNADGGGVAVWLAQSTFWSVNNVGYQIQNSAKVYTFGNNNMLFPPGGMTPISPQ